MKFSPSTRVRHPNNAFEMRVKEYVNEKVLLKSSKNYLNQSAINSYKYVMTSNVVCHWYDNENKLQEKIYSESELISCE